MAPHPLRVRVARLVPLWLVAGALGVALHWLRASLPFYDHLILLGEGALVLIVAALTWRRLRPRGARERRGGDRRHGRRREREKRADRTI